MKQILKYTGYSLIILLIGFLICKFYYILGWVFIAAVISFVGEPFVRFFDRMHIKKVHLPHWLSTMFALFVILSFFLGVVAVFVPLILSQAKSISSIDIDKIGEEFQTPIRWIDDKLHKTGSMPEDQTLKDYLAVKLKSIINFESIGGFVTGFFSAAGSIFIGLFAILFISFFFLKEKNMLEYGISLFIPEQHHIRTKRVINDSKRLLKRYFIGILVELACVISLLTLGMWIIGIKNSLLIGFFGGIMNIIPYLGPIIGSAIAITLGLTSSLASGDLNDLLPVMIKLISVLAIVQLLDNYVIVPIIYAKSVKSHPLEIFIAIIVGGGIAGLPGMLLTVPIYTVCRVVTREFMQETRLFKGNKNLFDILASP
jgi:predicted PurR-regulated permease PerM